MLKGRHRSHIYIYPSPLIYLHINIFNFVLWVYFKIHRIIICIYREEAVCKYTYATDGI